MSEKELKSRIFDKDLDVEKELREIAEKWERCEHETGHKNTIYKTPGLITKVSARAAYYEIPNKVTGKCQDCGYPFVTRELTSEERKRIKEQRVCFDKSKTIMK